MKKEAEKAAQEQLHDFGNLERFTLWLSAGGMENGLTWAEISQMEPEDVRDFQLLTSIYGPLARKYRKRREAKKSKAKKGDLWQ